MSPSVLACVSDKKGGAKRHAGDRPDMLPTLVPPKGLQEAQKAACDTQLDCKSMQYCRAAAYLLRRRQTLWCSSQAALQQSDSARQERNSHCVIGTESLHQMQAKAGAPMVMSLLNMGADCCIMTAASQLLHPMTAASHDCCIP